VARVIDLHLRARDEVGRQGREETSGAEGHEEGQGVVAGARQGVAVAGSCALANG
jgi:hypothetical protein